MIYATLAVQAAVIAIMLLLSEPASITRNSAHEPQHLREHPLPAGPTRLRCRIYFGCIHD